MSGQWCNACGAEMIHLNDTDLICSRLWKYARGCVGQTGTHEAMCVWEAARESAKSVMAGETPPCLRCVQRVKRDERYLNIIFLAIFATLLIGGLKEGDAWMAAFGIFGVVVFAFNLILGFWSRSLDEKLEERER